MQNLNFYCIDSTASLLYFFKFPIYHLQYYHNPQTLACLDRLDVIPVVIFIIQFSCSCQTTLTVLLRQFELPIKGIMIRINLDHFYQQFTLISLSEADPSNSLFQGYQTVPFNSKVLAKFGLCSNCLQKLHGCSLARSRKIFATAGKLAFSLTRARLLEISLILLCSYFLNIYKRYL